MPICKKCNAKFPNRIKIGNKIKVLGNRKFCLECSPYNMHNTRDLNKKSTIICDEKSCPKEKLCPSCNVVLPISSFGIHQKKDRKGKPFCIFTLCKKCDSIRIKERKRRIKQLSVEYKGGKCCRCGYDKCLRSLDFHHQDESEKDFGVSAYSGSNFDDIKKELDKCILVCKNCHGEIHDEIERNSKL